MSTWKRRPCLPDGLTGPGRHEQQAGALRGEQRHEERMEPWVRGGIQYLITAQNSMKNKRSHKKHSWI